VFVNDNNKEIEVPVGANLREEALKAGVVVYPGLTRYLNCFGHGTCGTCAVVVKKGKENLSPPGRFEKMRLKLLMSNIGREGVVRLSCQCKVMGDCSIETRTTMQLSPETDAKGKYFWET